MSTGSNAAKDRWPIVLGFFAAGNLVNAVWMLASPAHWYLNLPANIPGTGPLNEHFVRDIGCIFLLLTREYLKEPKGERRGQDL